MDAGADSDNNSRNSLPCILHTPSTTASSVCQRLQGLDMQRSVTAAENAVQVGMQRTISEHRTSVPEYGSKFEAHGSTGLLEALLA